MLDKLNCILVVIVVWEHVGHRLEK